MPNDKLKITQKEFDAIYKIEGITGETEAKPGNSSAASASDIPNKQDTTPEFLTEEEQEYDDKLFEAHPTEEDK